MADKDGTLSLMAPGNCKNDFSGCNAIKEGFAGYGNGAGIAVRSQLLTGTDSAKAVTRGCPARCGGCPRGQKN